MNKGCSLFTHIKHVKILCIFIIKGRAIRKLMGEEGGGGGGTKYKKKVFVRGKIK